MGDSVRPEIRGRANKNHSEILRAFRMTTQERVAELTGLSPTTISRMKEAVIPDLSAILAACGLKVVPETHKTYAPERIQALTTLAREALGAEGASSEFGDEL